MNAMTMTNDNKTTQKIPPVKISRRDWRRLSQDVKRHSKEFVEQALGIVAFHDGLHATNTPHWVERRGDGVYLIWGDDASNVAFLPEFKMDDMSIGTRIEG